MQCLRWTAQDFSLSTFAIFLLPFWHFCSQFCWSFSPIMPIVCSFHNNAENANKSQRKMSLRANIFGAMSASRAKSCKEVEGILIKHWCIFNNFGELFTRSLAYRGSVNERGGYIFVCRERRIESKRWIYNMHVVCKWRKVAEVEIET